MVGLQMDVSHNLGAAFPPVASTSGGAPAQGLPATTTAVHAIAQPLVQQALGAVTAQIEGRDVSPWAIPLINQVLSMPHFTLSNQCLQQYLSPHGPPLEVWCNDGILRYFTHQRVSEAINAQLWNGLVVLPWTVTHPVLLNVNLGELNEAETGRAERASVYCQFASEGEPLIQLSAEDRKEIINLCPPSPNRQSAE